MCIQNLFVYYVFFILCVFKQQNRIYHRFKICNTKNSFDVKKTFFLDNNNKKMFTKRCNSI